MDERLEEIMKQGPGLIENARRVLNDHVALSWVNATETLLAEVKRLREELDAAYDQLTKALDGTMLRNAVMRGETAEDEVARLRDVGRFVILAARDFLANSDPNEEQG